MLKEHSDNYKELHGYYKESIVKNTNMRKDIEIIDKSQEEMKDTIFEMENTLEGIKTRLDDTEE